MHNRTNEPWQNDFTNELKEKRKFLLFCKPCKLFVLLFIIPDVGNSATPSYHCIEQTAV